MINKDKFDTLENVIFDRSVFSHLAVFALTFSATLGVEMGVEASYSDAPTPVVLLWICAIVGVVGLIFLAITIWKQVNYGRLRAGLFAGENLISDETHIHTSDGTTIRVDRQS